MTLPARHIVNRTFAFCFWALLLVFSLAIAGPAYAGNRVQPSAGAGGASVTGAHAGSATAKTKKPLEDEAYTYQSGGRRDPFLSLVYTARQAMKKKASLGVPPLQRYAVSDFKLEAVVTGAGRPSYALVGLPNGKDYIIKAGQKAGINGGRVVKIGPDYVEVRETAPGIGGHPSAHTIILKLRKQEE